jgi:hypothetical protein
VAFGSSILHPPDVSLNKRKTPVQIFPDGTWHLYPINLINLVDKKTSTVLKPLKP